jgi:hypothetical protein
VRLLKIHWISMEIDCIHHRYWIMRRMLISLNRMCLYLDCACWRLRCCWILMWRIGSILIRLDWRYILIVLVRCMNLNLGICLRRCWSIIHRIGLLFCISKNTWKILWSWLLFLLTKASMLLWKRIHRILEVSRCRLMKHSSTKM